MDHGLKSLKRDWRRWSPAERLIAVAILVIATAVLGGPVAGIL